MQTEEATAVGPEVKTRIAANVERVRRRVAEAAGRSGRSPEDVCIVGISKTFGPECVDEAVAAGIHDIGENRVQEASEKFKTIKSRPVRHMVGHLQSNKARAAVELFDWIHSVDSVRLMDRIGKVAGEIDKQIRLLIEVSLAGEAAKSGAEEREVPDICRAAGAWPGVTLCGLMCVPPFFDDPELVRPYFVRLRDLLEELRRKGFVSASARHLSMGMSHDLDVAVEEGATMIRIGTDIFGPRRV
jgi:pyridoxal phosphate enzyme (YggS family)